MLDTDRWLRTAGKWAYSPKGWYLAKNPFGNEVFSQAAKDIKAALRALAGKTKKLLVLDLDETLWGGILGDVGWENLIIGGHDAVGEAFADFQHELKALRQRGVLLAIASKNDEPAALEAIAKHPEMILKKEDFVSWRINWNDKAANIAELVLNSTCVWIPSFSSTIIPSNARELAKRCRRCSFRSCRTTGCYLPRFCENWTASIPVSSAKRIERGLNSIKLKKSERPCVLQPSRLTNGSRSWPRV